VASADWKLTYGVNHWTTRKPGKSLTAILIVAEGSGFGVMTPKSAKCFAKDGTRELSVKSKRSWADAWRFQLDGVIVIGPH